MFMGNNLSSPLFLDHPYYEILGLEPISTSPATTGNPFYKQAIIIIDWNQIICKSKNVHMKVIVVINKLLLKFCC